MIRHILLFGVFASIAMFGDEISLYGPGMGLVADGGRLRPVLGFPGSAYIGPALALPFVPDSLLVGPEQSYSLAMTGGRMVLLDASKANLQIRDVEGVTDVARAWFSPAGKAAVLVSSDGLRCQILSGLPATPTVVASFTLSSPASAAAISEDAQSILTSSGDGTLQQWGGDGTLHGSIAVNDVATIQFFNNSHDAMVASHADARVYRLRASGEAVPLRDVDAIGLASSKDDSVLYLLSAEGVLLAQRESGELAGTYATPIPPTRLRRMGGVISLNEYDGGPLLIFDGARTWLVPPAKDGGAQ